MSDFQHNNYDVRDFSDGFETGSGLYRIASHLAYTEDTTTGFAFCVGSIALSLHNANPSDEELFQAARRAIVGKLDEGDVKDRDEFTFVYDPEQKEFVEVTNPDWWVKTLHSDKN